MAVILGGGGAARGALRGVPVTTGGSGIAQTAMIPGYRPDYSAAIAANPGVVAASGAGQMNVGQQSALGAQAVRTAAMQYGGSLGGFADPNHFLTPGIAQAAANNPYSTTAQQNRQYGMDVRDLQAQLAGRGMLESGDLGYGLQNLDYSRGLARSNAATAFGSALDQANQGLASAQQAAAQNNATAVRNAVGQEYKNPSLRPGQPTTAHYVQGSYQQHGVALYASGGRLYTADGKPYVQPPAPPRISPASVVRNSL